MNNLASHLQHGHLWLILLVAMRFYGVMMICPLFGKATLPRMFKMLLSMGFAIIIGGGMESSTIASMTITIKMLLLIKELLIGMLVGYVFSFPLWMIENVGNLIDAQRGEQIGAMINQLTKNPTSSISKLILQGFISYLVMANGLLFLIKMIMNSFLIFHCDSFTWAKSVPKNVFIELFSNYFYWVVILALPIVFLMFLVEMVLGLLSTFIQQLNVTVLSMSIKSALALFVLLFYIGVLYHVALSRFVYPTLTLLFKG